MPAATRVGLDCKTYWNSTGNYNSPSWVEVTIIRDLTSSHSKTKAEFSTRGTGKYKAYKGAMKDIDFQFDVVADHNDTKYLAFWDSYFNYTQMDMLFLDGAINVAGNKGFRVQCEVFEIEDSEPLDDAKVNSVTMAPTYDPDHPPVQYTS